MKIKLFDYGLLSPEICAHYHIQCVQERAVGFGKLFTDGEKPVLFPEGDDNDKFYGSLYECEAETLKQLSDIWPAYAQTEIMAYTAEGMFEAFAFVQSLQQVQQLTYLEYPEWQKTT